MQEQQENGEPASQVLDSIRGLKDQGNDCFKGGRFWTAMKWFEAGLQAARQLLMDLSHKESGDVSAAARELSMHCLLNIAAAGLKLSEWDTALKACNKVS